MPKHHHKFRQSQIKTASLCLERSRREQLPDAPRRETDAANVGSAVHTAIEETLAEGYDLGTSVEVFDRDFSDRMAHPLFEFVKYNEKTARKFGARCVRQWYEQVLPTLSPKDAELEVSFCLPFHEDDVRTIDLAGTIDYVGADGTLLDWKTSSREWQAWEHARWDPQATAYTWAAWKLDLLHGGSWDADPEWAVADNIAAPFEFVVLGGKVPQRITVWRRPSDWHWLRQRCIELAELIEADLPRWPTNDAHALCSEKFCDFWSTCKGAFVAPTWPK